MDVPELVLDRGVSNRVCCKSMIWTGASQPGLYTAAGDGDGAGGHAAAGHAGEPGEAGGCAGLVVTLTLRPGEDRGRNYD